VPEHIRVNLHVQIVSLESILELTTSKRENHINTIRAQALSVFSQCRRLMSHISNVKSLTGFGPAANADLFLKSKDVSNSILFFKGLLN
jgi:mediator of RNA polymerase II transcription subunit 13